MYMYVYGTREKTTYNGRRLPPHSRSVASWDRGFDGFALGRSGLAALTLPLSISSQRSSARPVQV